MPDERTVHAASIEVFWRLHQGLPKQGPGSDSSTRRALSLAGELPAQPSLLDLGCGPGRQTLVLAQETGGSITAIDLLPPFLEQLDQRAREAGLSDRITTRQASMADLDLPDASVDLIWSEGAIYNIGFSNGLRLWRRLLRPGGSVAVSEVAWLVERPPDPIRSYWEEHYPGIQHRAANEDLIAQAGYRLIDSFVLPDAEWWDDYYSLIEERLETLRSEQDDADSRKVLSYYDQELQIIRDGLDSFGYVFYVMTKDEE